MTTKKIIKIATRKSKLALWQANFVKEAFLKNYSKIQVEFISIVTEGDRQALTSTVEATGKSNFVKALQTAVLNREADIAVHSMKDLSVLPVEKITLAAICERATPFDAFVSNHYLDLFSLPAHAVVGTASPRRTCVIKSLRPDVQVKGLRGNVDTRLAKLDAGEYDAIILAAAGLERLGLKSRIRSYFSEETMTPAIGQGAIGIECREDDDEMLELVSFLNHAPTAHCVMTERVVNQVIGGDCETAIGAYAKIVDDQMHLSGMLGNEETGKIVRARLLGTLEDTEKLGKAVARELRKGLTEE